MTKFNTFLILPLQRMATLLRQENVQHRRKHEDNTGKAPKITNFKIARHDPSALIVLLSRFMGLAKASPEIVRRPHYAYGILTTHILRVSRLHDDLPSFLLLVHGDYKNWSDFGNLISKKDNAEETSYAKPLPWPRHIDISDGLHLTISKNIIR